MERIQAFRANTYVFTRLLPVLHQGSLTVEMWKYVIPHDWVICHQVLTARCSIVAVYLVNSCYYICSLNPYANKQLPYNILSGWLDKEFKL